MLVEFAFTPEVFDEQSNPDGDAWRDQLRDLGSRMFPMNSASPVVVSNLGDGGWMHEVETIVGQVTNHHVKQLFQSLLVKVKDVLVRRPLRGDWPVDELAWAREAVAHTDEPMDRIVATSAAQATLASEGCKVRSLDEVQESGFWTDVSTTAYPRMEIKGQIGLLRRVCLHADFVAFISPRIYGGGDDEIDFALALSDSCFTRSSGYPTPAVEIHTGDLDTTDSQLSNIAVAIRNRIKSDLKPGQSVKLVLWPRKLLHRRLLAGLNTESSSGKLERSPKWGLAMDHVARRTDDPNKLDPAAWHLLRRDALGDLYRQFSLTATPKPHIVEVRG